MLPFEDRIAEAFNLINEDNDIVDMSTSQYAHNLEKSSLEPSRGTLRDRFNKEWYGGRPNGARMPKHSGAKPKSVTGTKP